MSIARPYYSGKILESGWLIAIIVTPLFINIYSIRIFEEDKVNLIRTLATVLLPLLLIHLLKNRPKGLLRTPLMLPVLFTFISLLLSTLFSILPSVSFFGEYFRRQGCYTHLTYGFFFLSIISLLRKKEQIDRLIDILIATTIPICLYGMLQYLGLDPFKWEWDTHNRIISTAGNAIFIAAYSTMVLPFTLICLLQRKRSRMQLSYYSFLLALQLSTIVASRSRGPLLALCIGLIFYAICYGLYQRQKKIMYTTALLSIFLFVFVAALNSQWSFMQPVRALPYLDRLSKLGNIGQHSQGIRLQIWKGISHMIIANPQRMIHGFGPETLQSTFVPYYPVELGKLSDFQLTADRAHNDTFDVLVTQGILGLLAKYLLFGCFCYYIFKWLGFISSLRHRNLFTLIMTVCAVFGCSSAVLLSGDLSLCGLGLPAGFILGLLAVLIVFGYSVFKVPKRHNPHALLLLAIFTSVIIHMLEIQVGIPITVTQLYFWIFLAVAIVAGTILPKVPSRRESNDNTSYYQTGFYGLIIIIMLYNFFTPAGWHTLLFPVYFIVTLILIIILLRLNQTGNTITLYQSLAIILVPALLYFLLHWLFLIHLPDSVMPANSPTEIPLYHRSLLLLYATVMLYAFLSPYAVLSKPILSFRGISYLLITGLFLLIALRYNINHSLADMDAKRAQHMEKSGQNHAAVIFYQRALDLYPNQQKYQLDMSRNCILTAQILHKQKAECTPYLKVAETILTNAYHNNPYNIDVFRGLAYMHRNWATLSDNRNDRQAHLNQADLYFNRAILLGTKNVRLWNEWALVAADLENYTAALQRLKHSLEIDTGFSDTYNQIGLVYLRLKQYQQAISSFRQSLRLNQRQISICHRIAAAYLHLRQPQEAIQAYLQAYLINPDQYSTLKGLLYLYTATGEYEKALIHAQKSLLFAPQSEKPLIRNEIKRLALLVR